MIMKNIFIILSFIASFEIRAASTPIPPSISLPYSTEPLLRSDGSNYMGDKGAYDATLENTNSRPIRCVEATFNVTIDRASASCTNPFISTTINLGNDKKILDIQPGQPFRNSKAGNAERLAFEKTTPSTFGLEFCSRDALNKDFRCGFNCDEKHFFDDKWTDNITGGQLDKHCGQDGVVVNDHLRCDLNKYIDGTDGKSCVPKDCGAVRHGERGHRTEIPYGFVTYLCSYGQWDDEKYECNAGAIKEGPSCRVGKTCGGRPHQDIWWLAGTCDTKTKTRATVKVVCYDGNISATEPRESKITACTPCRGSSCGSTD